MTDLYDYYLEQAVKYMMYVDLNELIEEIEDGGYFELDCFGFDHLEKLDEIILNNQTKKLIYPEMQEHLYEVLSFLEEYVSMNEEDYAPYLQKLSIIRNNLDHVITIDLATFIKEEFEKREDTKATSILMETNYNAVVMIVLDSIVRDETYISYLDPELEFEKYDVSDQLENSFLLLSLNAFYKEKPNLFLNPIVERRIRYILMKLMNQKAIKGQEQFQEIIKDTSSKLLKKLVK